MTAGRRAIALMSVGILAAGVWQVRATAPRPAGVASPVMNVETENARVRPPVVRAASKPLSPVQLVPFDGCAPMLRHLRAKALPTVTAWGMQGTFFHGGFHGDVVRVDGRRATGAPASSPATGRGAPAPMSAVAGMTVNRDFSGTNVQEEGVDEPDIVKTDGRTLYSIARGRLFAVDVTGARPRLLGSVGLAGFGHQILMAGKRIMVFSTDYGLPNAAPSDWRALAHLAIAIIDISHPERMYVHTRLRVEGALAAARLVGGVARIVVRSGPALRFPDGPANPGAGEKAAQKRNRAIVRGAGPDKWLPDFVLERDGRRVASGVAVPCSRVSRPGAFAGLGTTTVLTIDPADPEPRDGTSVNADANIVYASADNLYVAATWIGATLRSAPSLVSTQIHKFDISRPGPAQYRGSGQARGQMINQWSMSEHEGFLRVVTTDWGLVGNALSESYVIVLQEREGSLVRISAVRGLGKGENVQSVRFIGDFGYVVTFRLIDPFYVVDLRNPWRPRLAGELKIPGFSAYLHPVGKDRILGIGMDAGTDGMTVGAKASLFDVSSPRKPKEIATLGLGSMPSQTQWDHHAFLWWARSHLAFVPALGTEGVGFRVQRDRLVAAGHVSHAAHSQSRPWMAAIQRATVIGHHLLTTSEAGLMHSDLGSLAEGGWLDWTR